MAIILCDGQPYDTTELQNTYRMWTGISQAAGLTVETTGGRANGRWIKQSYTYRNMPYFYKRLSANYQTLIVSFAYQVINNSTSTIVVAFDDAGASTQCYLQEVLGVLRMVNGNGTVLGTSPVPLLAGVWYQIEIKVTINTGTSGSAYVRVNEESVISLPNCNTRQSSNNQVNQVVFGTNNGFYVDHQCGYGDILIMDTSGSYCKDFIGIRQLKLLTLSADGYYKEWTPSTGTDHYTLVDEIPPVTTDYIKATAANQRDTFVVGDITQSDIEAIIISPLLFSDKLRVAILARSNSNDGVGDTTIGQSQAWQYAHSAIYRDPNGGGAWSMSGVNNAEFGIKSLPY